MQPITKIQIVSFYLDYVNNFITAERMAEYYEMPEEDCIYIIELGRKYHEEDVETYKFKKVVKK